MYLEGRFISQSPKPVKLLFVSETNLRDQFFIRDFVHNFKFEEKALLVHAPFGSTERDTRFVTRRFSSLLSEAMVYNSAFMARQRNLVQRGPTGHYRVDTARILALLAPVQVLIIGPEIVGDYGPHLDPGPGIVDALRRAFGVEEVLLFSDHSRSPLAQSRPLVQAAADIEPLLKVYEEEAPVLNLAVQLAPARIVSPVNYAH